MDTFFFEVKQKQVNRIMAPHQARLNSPIDGKTPSALV